MNTLLLGAIAMGSAVAGLFFFKFWRRSHDRFFIYFALSFWLEALNRVVLAFHAGDELAPVIYGLRVVAYGLILFAIIQKNRGRPR